MSVLNFIYRKCNTSNLVMKVVMLSQRRWWTSKSSRI